MPSRKNHSLLANRYSLSFWLGRSLALPFLCVISPILRLTVSPFLPSLAPSVYALCIYALRIYALRITHYEPRLTLLVSVANMDSDILKT